MSCRANPGGVRGEIEALWDELDSCTDQLGPHHKKTLNLAHQLAIAMWAANEVQGAVDILNLALSCTKTSLGKDHPIHTDVLRTLGRIMFD